MTTRLISAAVLLPVVALVVTIGGIPFIITALVVALLAGFELFSLLRLRGYHPFTGLGLAITALLVLDPSVMPAVSRQTLLTAVLVFSLLWPLTQRQREGSLVNWALTVAGAIYIGWLAAHLVFLRALPRGMEWTVMTLIGTWSTDSGAYLAGRRWGNRRLAPEISPKKTWEGALGGVTACVTATALLGVYWLGVSPLAAAVLGLSVAIAAILGDLIESWVKRQLGAKDSGITIPGHGGMLDRIDSLLLTGVVVYYFVIYFG